MDDLRNQEIYMIYAYFAVILTDLCSMLIIISENLSGKFQKIFVEIYDLINLPSFESYKRDVLLVYIFNFIG